MYKLEPGLLDRRVVIESSTVARDSYGEPIETWAAVATVYAQVTEDGGIESFRSDRQAAERRALFLLRWRSGITEKHRIVWDSRNWDITGVRQLGRQQALEIRAESRDGDQ